MQLPGIFSFGRAVACCVVLVVSFLPDGGAQTLSAGWPAYGGDIGGQRYSIADQINKSNVKHLHSAWVYHSRALDSGRSGSLSAAFEATPILFRSLLYLSTPFDEVIALDPLTGSERWRYQPQLSQLNEGDIITSRGVAAWSGGGGAESMFEQNICRHP
ncbi:hypothetical protein [Acidicapsa acidisoli]